MDAFDPIVVHGPREPVRAIVLDSPHSGTEMPGDFDTVLPLAVLREGEDSFIDALWRPAAERGMPVLAARFPRTYLDPNRHADDLDPDLLAEPWPGPIRDSGKSGIGKSLIWRTVKADQPIYARRLTVAEVRKRIERCHVPYHRTLRDLLDAAHRRFGRVIHFNCHSMGATTSLLIEGVEGRPRPDFVLGDREGSSCDPGLTAFVRERLAAHGYDVRVNDPFKGVELVRAYSDPAAGRHSLQIEVNKRLYMDERSLQPHGGFAVLQRQLMQLLEDVDAHFGSA